MSVPLEFRAHGAGVRIGLKGPKAAQWLLDQGIKTPKSPNTWTLLMRGNDAPDERVGNEVLIARLGGSEFFLEEAEGGNALRTLAASLAPAPGVYPVLREDAAFLLRGAGSHDVLAQVCNLDFARVPDGSRRVIMTMMVGVAVLVLPDEAPGETAESRVASRSYRIWCDPSFGPYLASTLGTVVFENGGKFVGGAA